MIRLAESIVVDAPPEEAFAYVSDFANVPEWDPGVVSARQLTVSEIGPGTHFALVARFAGRDVPMIYKVTDWDPPHRVVLSGNADAMDAIDTIEVSPYRGGARIDYTADLTFKGFLSFLEPLLKGRLISMGRNALAGLEGTMARQSEVA